MLSITATDILEAQKRLNGVATRTAILSNTFLNDHFHSEIFLKCELFQPIGAFKIRGAGNFAWRLSDEERQRGFVTHSSGNHAQAVAYMAHKMNTKAWIVMPSNASRTKVLATKRWGAVVIDCEPTIAAREAGAEQLRKEHDATIIPPFDHEWIMEGQATASLELLQEVDDVDVLLAPLGGGGLLSGTALSARYFGKVGLNVVGVEPETAADGKMGLAKGKRVESLSTNTVADGLRTTVGRLPFEVLKTEKVEVITASDEAIMRWQRRFWNELKLIMEPSSAVVFAAMDDEPMRWAGQRIGAIITGGNAEISALR